MEDKKLNEQESLELIARMIRNSKRNVRENAGGPALIGGYATVLTSLLVYAGWMLTHQYYSMYGWFLIPVFGGIGTFLFGRHEKPVLQFHPFCTNKRTLNFKLCHQIIYSAENESMGENIFIHILCSARPSHGEDNKHTARRNNGSTCRCACHRSQYGVAGLYRL